MNTKQIIDEMVRTLAARTWSADHKGTFVDFLDGVESVVNPAVRKLIESLAEDIIPKESFHSHEIKDDIIYLKQEGADLLRWEQGYNSAVKDARLKVKEIINSLEK